MATKDTQHSILDYLNTLLTNDTTLKANMGGSVSHYPVWAKADAEFPYLVHRIDIRATDFYPYPSGTLYIDIWSYSKKAAEALLIRKRIIELLDEREFSTDEVKGGYIWIQTDGFVPEETENIWHYAMQFNIKFYRSSEVDMITSR